MLRINFFPADCKLRVFFVSLGCGGWIIHGHRSAISKLICDNDLLFRPRKVITFTEKILSRLLSTIICFPFFMAKRSQSRLRLRLHQVGEIHKRRFHSEDASIFSVHTTPENLQNRSNHRSV